VKGKGYKSRYVWLSHHVACWLSSCITLEYSPDARASCKISKEKLIKGELRVKVTAGETKAFAKLSMLVPLLLPVCSTNETTVDLIPGFENLEAGSSAV